MRSHRLVPQIRNRLESAFPIRPEHLEQRARELAVSPEVSRLLRERFASISRAILPGLDIVWEPQADPGILLGRRDLGTVCSLSRCS